MNNYKKLVKYVCVTVAAILLIMFAFSFRGVVPQNHVGILIRAGVTQERELDEGWKFKIPFIDRIITMSNQVQTLRIASGGVKNPTTNETAETLDRQLIPTFEFEIQYQLAKDKSFDVYKAYGQNYESKLIESNALAIIKQVFSLYGSESIVEKKVEIPDKVGAMLNEITEPVGVVIKRVNMKTYDFTAEYTSLLEERAMLAAQLKNNEIKQNNDKIAAQTAYDVAVKNAEKEAETARINAESSKEVGLIYAEQKKEIALIEAQAQADAKKIEVDNEAYVITTKAEAEKTARLAAAEATKAELEAQASGLNALVIQKQWIEKWNGQLLPDFGGGTTFSYADFTEIIKQYLPSTGE